MLPEHYECHDCDTIWVSAVKPDEDTTVLCPTCGSDRIYFHYEVLP